MSNPNANPAQAQEQDVEKVRAEAFAKGKAEATTEAVAAALKQDRERIAAITGGEEAKGREDLAQNLAMTGMAAETAIAALKVAPKAAAEKPAETKETAYLNKHSAASGLNIPNSPAATENALLAAVDARNKTTK